ncbi:hypothetical protein II906_03305 [bacterium]|nr:hypothetical protein [bacterium]
MDVSNVSFKGLWQMGERTQIKRVYKSPVHSQELVYRPFADENRDVTDRNIEKYHDRIFEETYDYSDEKSYIWFNVKRGDTLKVTKAEYEEMQGMKPRLSNSDFKTYVYRTCYYRPCFDNEAIAQKIKKNKDIK